MTSGRERVEPTREDTVLHRSAPGVWPDPPVPTAADLAEARAVVAAAHRPTPLILSHQLSATSGREIYLKLEGTSAVRSFKFRGALVAVSRAAQESPGRTIVTASTGNHGQGIAFAGARHGLDVIICSPESTLAAKLAAMQALGASVLKGGDSLTDAEAHAREVAAETGGLYIEDGESPDLMAGAATVVLEMLEQEPDLDSLIVPVGGGNLIAASLLASSGSQAEVVGVQSAQAPGATESWLAGEIVRRPCRTYAGGLATERPGQLSLSVMTQMLETMILVDDADLRAESVRAFRSLGLVAEGAAAAPLTALRLHSDAIPGNRIGVIVSGSWLSHEQLADGLAAGDGEV